MQMSFQSASTERRAGRKPVVAVSTLDLADEALEAGASAFLQKPVGPLQLVSAVRDLAGRSAWAGQHVRQAVPES